jgi:hypothetical protein
MNSNEAGDQPTSERNRPASSVARRAGRILLVVIGIVVFFTLPLPDFLPSIDFPDAPGWLDWLLGWPKFVLLAVVVVLAAASEVRGESTDSPED